MLRTFTLALAAALTAGILQPVDAADKTYRYTLKVPVHVAVLPKLPNGHTPKISVTCQISKLSGADAQMQAVPSPFDGQLTFVFEADKIMAGGSDDLEYTCSVNPFDPADPKFAFVPNVMGNKSVVSITGTLPQPPG